jgi:hypothetical protein
MRIIDLKQCNNIIGHGPHSKGRIYMGGRGKGKETKNLNVVDMLTI